MWSEAGDIVECRGDGKQNLVVPSFDVEPKGWYAGEFANQRGRNLPHFDHLEVSFVTKECGTPRLTFKKKDVDKFRWKIAQIFLPCGELAKVRFVGK
jgi:hypothetical protein